MKIVAFIQDEGRLFLVEDDDGAALLFDTTQDVALYLDEAGEEVDYFVAVAVDL